MQPSPRADTSRLLFPSLRFSIAFSPLSRTGDILIAANESSPGATAIYRRRPPPLDIDRPPEDRPPPHERFAPLRRACESRLRLLGDERFEEFFHWPWSRACHPPLEFCRATLPFLSP